MEQQGNEHSFRLVLPPGFSPECLNDGWHMERQRLAAAILTFYDTFEWGLWFGGYALHMSGEEYVLHPLTNGWPGTATCTERGTGRRFWHDFSTDAMRVTLRELLGLRGLAPVASGRFSTQLCELRNKMGKIVCRVEWSTVTAEAGRDELFTYCRILPLRGYAGEAARVVEMLTNCGATHPGPGPVAALMQHAGQEPRVYTLKPTFNLSFDTPAREAVGRIATTILAIAESNVPWIVDDLDTEFLHDYRICLRKARSLLGLVKDVYPPGEISRLRKRLGDLARTTNRLRDLDVYLLARLELLEGVPEALHQGLEQIFAEFSVEREGERRSVSTHLHGRSGIRTLHGIMEFFSPQRVNRESATALLPIGPLVFRSIYKRYRKIRTIGKGIGDGTADATLHQLRIEGKKLRYLMEFFNELLPAEEGAFLQKQLRCLQGRLGKFNDSSVQQRFLLDWWHENRSGMDDALAMGGLLTLLYQRRQLARIQIDAVLQEFIGDNVSATFKRVFRHPAVVPGG